MSMPIKPISPADIKFALKNIKKNKAPGYDLITGKILQELPERGILLMTHIFNAMLRHCYWTVIWKYADIIMIKPNKPPEEVTSYRGISLLPAKPKLFERILLKRIMAEDSADRIVPDHQFGFRFGHSTDASCCQRYWRKRVTDAQPPFWTLHPLLTGFGILAYCTS
ncbi:hypothetical protein M8J75_013571 [Diaphorina citri]|nr:hypothetical protein M8J75_013571 [Diaphorina citri]